MRGRATANFRKELANLKEKGKKLTGALRLEDRFYRRIYTHDPSFKKVDDFGQPLGKFIEREVAPRPWRSMSNDVLLDRITTTTKAMRARGNYLKNLGMRRRDMGLVTKGNRLVSRASSLKQKQMNLRNLLRETRFKEQEFKRSLEFGGVRGRIKQGIKTRATRAIKHHRGEVEREGYLMDELIQSNKKTARAYYKEIVAISKEMRREMIKKDPLIDHFVSLGRDRLAYVKAYNKEAKRLNKILRSVHATKPAKKRSNLTKGFLFKKPKQTTLVIGKDGKPVQNIRTIVSMDDLKRINKLLNNPLPRVPYMKIPKKYQFTIVAE